MSEKPDEAGRQFKVGHVYSIDVFEVDDHRGEGDHLLRGSLRVDSVYSGKHAIILQGELIENGKRYEIALGKGIPF